MKLEQLSISDLIALRDELHRRILTCYKDRYLVIAGKKTEGPSQDEYLQLAAKYSEQFEIVKIHLDHRLNALDFGIIREVPGATTPGSLTV